VARIWLVMTSPSPPQRGGEGRGEVARIKSPLSGSLPAPSRGERVVISTPSEVREKFRRVKPLKDISVKERGWTPDVLNVVRRIVEERARALDCGGRAERRHRFPREPETPSIPERRGAPLPAAVQNELASQARHQIDAPNQESASRTVVTNEDVYAFTRELEQLHPDNRSLRTATR
jgi:hypothetical protein